MKIKQFQYCKCGAVTLFFENGAISSMSKKTYRSLKPDVSNADRLENAFCCDHCINHYGIDLCECGSGKAVGKCSCGSNKAMQEFGVELDHIGMIMKNFYGR